MKLKSVGKVDSRILNCGNPHVPIPGFFGIVISTLLVITTGLEVVEANALVLNIQRNDLTLISSYHSGF